MNTRCLSGSPPTLAGRLTPLEAAELRRAACALRRGYALLSAPGGEARRRVSDTCTRASADLQAALYRLLPMTST